MVRWKRLAPAPLAAAARRVRARLLRRSPETTPAASQAEPAVRSREELHAYWRDPDAVNRPEDYTLPVERSAFLTQLLARYGGPSDRVLEIGSNVGRNLKHLRRAGYGHLEGIEISSSAIEAMQASYPGLAGSVTMHNAPVEDVIRTFDDSSFDVVFTMAVLEHLHPESEWVFAEMVRICRGVLVTIEDERGRSWRHVPRNYRTVFEALGVRQLDEIDPAGAGGLTPDFRARVFACRP